jgi:hypothetical protein
MKRAILAGAVTFLLAAPAFAFGCPGLMAQVDAALAANPSLSAEQLAQVQALRAEGEAQHAAGQHAQSMETLNQALEILGAQ